MVFRVPAVAPSAPRTHAHQEKPAPGVALVPIMLYRLNPLFNVKLVASPLAPVTPEKLVPPALAKYATPAPTNGPVLNSD